jgi:hypothetical protein
MIVMTPEEARARRAYFDRRSREMSGLRLRKHINKQLTIHFRETTGRRIPVDVLEWKGTPELVDAIASLRSVGWDVTEGPSDTLRIENWFLWVRLPSPNQTTDTP